MAYVKSLHLIFIVTWFAALFYFPRLLVYHIEAGKKGDPERGILQNQYRIMQRRLWYGIAWPSMILTLIFGSWLLVGFGRFSFLMREAWFILKICFVLGLLLYHFRTHLLFRDFQNNIVRWSSFRMRLWNEVPTVFLVAIIFLVVPQQNSGWVWALLALIFLSAAIFAGIYFYRKQREAEEKEKTAAASATERQQETPPPPPPPTIPPASQT